MGRSLEELEVMFSEGRSIFGIVRDSKKPLIVGFGEGVDFEKDERIVKEDDVA
jgi:hypothetical protein